MNFRLRSIEHRLTLYVLLFSVVFGLIFSAVQISYDYVAEGKRFQQQVDQLLEYQQRSAAYALYNYDDRTLNTMLQSLLLNDAVVAASIVEDSTNFNVRVGIDDGQLFEQKPYLQTFVVSLREPPEFGQSQRVIGYLTLWADQRLMRAGFEQRSALALGLDLLRNVILGLVLLWVFRSRLTGPIRRLAEAVLDINPMNPMQQPLRVEPPLVDTELDDLVKKTNALLANMEEGMVRRQQAERRVRQLNEQLEEKVKARTQALNDSNSQLRHSISELQRTQDLLLQAQRMASLGHFAAGMAHEINNPIAVVYSNIATLSEYLTELLELADQYQHAEQHIHDDSIRHALERARVEVDLTFVRDDAPSLIATSKHSLERVRNIVRELRTFAEADAEKMIVDVAEVLRSALNQCQKKRDDVRVIAQYADGAQVHCAPDQLRIALGNILDNAYEAMPQGGTLEIAVDQETSYVDIVIRDTGVGMSSEDVSCAINPFFTRKEVGQGIGMGLTVAYNVVTNQGGELQISSEEGRGTTVTVRFTQSPESLVFQ
ncbi:MAG: ATP-binding protein [Bacterioplanes sp.]|nr:ATP-binding protein [Bacterioplanes sp.]